MTDQLEALVGPAVAAWVRKEEYAMRAGQLARHIDCSTPVARRLLDRCVHAGLLERDRRYSAINCAAWRLPGAK